MPAEWINLDKLGTKGIEPDLMPPHREPQSLDEAVNVRALGPNLANAGGYLAVENSGFPALEAPGVPADACIAANPPDECLRVFTVNGTYGINRYYTYNWDDKNNFITTVAVNANSEEYDVILRQPQYAYDDSVYLGGVRVRVLNSSGQQRVLAEQLNADGSVASTQADYDASTEFGDGNIHWVTARWYRGAGTGDLHLMLDGTLIWQGSFPSQGNLDQLFVVETANKTGTGGISFGMWNYSITVWNCLTSGTFQSLGGLSVTDKNPKIRYDPINSSQEHVFAYENLIAVPKAGGEVYRTAFLDAKLFGRKYWEVLKVDAQGSANTEKNEGCSIISNNSGKIGRYVDSWGLESDGAGLWINAVNKNVSIGLRPHRVYCCDFSTGDLWIGESDGHQTGGAIVAWLDGADPYNGDPASYNIYATAGSPASYDPKLCINRYGAGWRMETLTTADGCAFDPPTGFSLLE